jgi:uncharacterized repeat protein (TIGR01451 family)
MQHKTTEKFTFSLKTFKFVCLVLLSFFAIQSTAPAVPPAAGTFINNTATVDALHSGDPFSAIHTSNTVRTTVVYKEPNIDIVLTASSTQLTPGESVTMTAVIQNLGPGTPLPLTITLDGNPVAIVPSTTVIPSGTTFAGIVAGFSGFPLYHISGDPANVFQSTPPSDLALVDSIGIGLNTLLPAATATFSFTLLTDSDNRDPIHTTATVEYIDPNDSSQDLIHSNELVITIAGTGNLLIQKKSSKSIVNIGESVDFEILVRNQNTWTESDVIVEDLLPRGLSYLPGSTRLSGSGIPAPEPSGGVGPRLEFPIGDIAPYSEISFMYRVTVGPGARTGDLINRATAYGNKGIGTASNTAASTIKIREGVFSERAILFGKVFVDKNANRIQDIDEPGIPGVQLIMEDGTSAITDLSGKYHIYGILPMTHVIKADRTSLPGGSELSAITGRNRSDSDYAFVDIKAGELFKVNFAETSATANILSQVQARLDYPEAFQSEIMARVDEKLRETPGVSESTGSRSGPAEGIIGKKPPVFKDIDDKSLNMKVITPGKNPGDITSLSETKITSNAQIASDGKPSVIDPLLPSSDIEELIKKVTKTLDFENLKDNQILSKQSIAIRIKGHSGANLVLSVNGKTIEADRIGAKTVMASSQVQMLEYIGVNLEEGENKISLTQSDSFGNERGRKTITVMAPGNLSKFVITGAERPIPASSAQLMPIVVELRDKNGLPVTYRTQISLTVDKGSINVEDLSPAAPGIQVFAENGTFTVPLRPPDEPGKAIFKVWNGDVESSVNLSFSPYLRPLVAVGIIEGKILHSNMKLDPGAILKAHSGDPFEQELRNIAESGIDKDDTNAAGRVAFFLKGKVKGDRLLTMAFDSEKLENERLFRDIQPDEFYPVYGDSSTKAFDAQSSGRLYVKLEKEQNYALYGDFTTAEDQPVGLSLGSYSRSMNGFKGRIEKDKGTITVFASEDSMRQVVEEIPANGTSGPFQLGNENIEPNSETVTIIVRDRNQPDLILSETKQTRFYDYGLEPYTGRIIFKKPFPSLDASLNPVSIRIVYEVATGGKTYLIAGTTAEWRFDEKTLIGGSYVNDSDPLNKNSLGSVHVVVKPEEGSSIEIEHAFTRSKLDGRGNATRVSIEHEEGHLNLQARYGTTDEKFINPTSLLSAGREEARLQATYKLKANERLLTDSIMTVDAVTGGRRLGHSLSYERKLKEGTVLELGVRHSNETSTGAQTSTTGVNGFDFTSVRVKATQPLGKSKAASVYAEYEQDVSDRNAKTVALGGDYKLTEKTKAYFRHELISSLAGRFALNSSQSQHSTVFGVESTYDDAARVFSEYRGSDAFNGRETEAAIGLRNGFSLGKGRKINTSFERITALQGTDSRESLAATAGFELTFSERWKATGRYEFRNSRSGDSDLVSMGFAYKLQEDWTFLGRYLQNDQTTDLNNNIHELMRLQLGFAYRPAHTDKWNALFMFENRSESDDSDTISGSNESASTIRTQFNFNPIRRFHFTGGYARQIVNERFSEISTASTLQLFSARATYDIGNRWDIGLIGRSLRGGGNTPGDDRSFGLEFGRRLTKDLWVSAGYNFNDFDGGDLSDDGYEEKGVYFRLRFKFDEGLFQGLAPQKIIQQVIAPQGIAPRGIENVLKAKENYLKNNKIIRHFEKTGVKIYEEGNLVK